MNAAEAQSRSGQAGAWRWTLLLPRGWVSLPTDAKAGAAAVRRLIDRRTAHLPRDEVAPARRRLTVELRGMLGEARDAGVEAVHAHLDLMRGLPVTATCSVLLHKGAAADPRTLAQLAGALGSADTVTELDVDSLAGLAAIRRRRRGVVTVDGAEASVPSTGLDWIVPLPDGEGVLAMSFSTVTEPVVEELVVLFDAIAGTLQLETEAPPRGV
ncbi:hypothetical protein DQ237_10150 [Blastococcus sp. TF02-8]|uniref:hypothetical protein n=1 Tax=Blastococcus sp. TF02-8 TaxID=2250574 RepID=UPI000DE9BC72|nr:hypothetical protein [Blastococcus sp. TF02-8]RBY96218.1 hypothetical protein DQ237_10150 [Blastococcus sp. TF02-8]